MKQLLLILVLPFITYCSKAEQTDLATLKLNEPVENLLSETSLKSIGTNSVEYPFAILAEDTDSTKFVFSNIPVDKVYFLLPAKVNNDSVMKNGGGRFDGTFFKTKKQLENNLKILEKQNISSEIFGFRAEIKGKKNQNGVKQLLIKKYGNGKKNPNTDNGLYWNVKNENKYIFFAPDYDRLIVVNSKNLSKTCYWDLQNGIINIGAEKCDSDKYFKEMGIGVSE
ncbi:hypothetical protein A0O34_17615 [Chryseobacterium glaciei]|uniref:Uncharacterized protein n=1 Tax=Chryseobacterium glaciei TaxID=1685010 RepID=A0A172XYX9_9FLAO|nr:hypothetical protein [Chryseobacterium glaciei]ANF52223.1 hypothetical protein A0O34_17615 [Chryseobacterium glaciei]